ncbi:MAG TPA: hypothetical protein VGE74_03060 [Gemmata sp.]
MRARYGAILAVALALFPAWVCAAPPALEIPAEVKPQQGYATVEPKTDAASVTYIALDGVFPFPSRLLKDARTFVLPAGGLKSGRYRFVAVAASKEGEQATAEFVVVIGDTPAPGPPPPGPQPDPPAPADPLVKLLGDAYATETAADKRERCRALADVMRFGVTAANDPAVTLNVNVAAAVTAERKDKVGESLPAVRKVIGQHLGGELGDAPKALDADLRAKTAAVYTKLARALDEVSK